MRALRYPRWEDFNYERLDKTNNRLYWLGDGMSYTEKTLTGDSAFYISATKLRCISLTLILFAGTWYINPNYVDAPPVPASETQ